VTETLLRAEAPGDAELISAVRGGDVSAYGELFARHADAARRLARQLVSHGDVDDLVSDAFGKVLVVLQRGGGPDLAFRAYLLTAVRRLHVDKIRATKRLTTTDDMEKFDPGVPFRDTAVEGFENAAAAKAFSSLPERWQLVLWHLEVEGQKPADIAPILGMSANSVSALAYRAREGLRQAFLNQHAQEAEDDICRWTQGNLGAYIRNGISKRDAGKVEAHLDECVKCMGVYLELNEVNSNLAGILAPLLLGSVGASYLAATASAATQGVVLLLVDRAKDWIGSNVPVAVAGSAAVVATVAGGAFLAFHDPDVKLAANPPAVVLPSATKSPGSSPSHRPTTSPSPTATRSALPSSTPTSGAPITSPASAPTSSDASTTPPTSSPTTTPPTTSPPTTPPPLPPLDLKVTPQGSRSGNDIHFTTTVDGVQQGKTARLHIWLSDDLFVGNAGLLLAPPKGCTFDKSSSLQLAFVCDVTPTTKVGAFDVTRAMGNDKGTVTFFVEPVTPVDSNEKNNTVAVNLAHL